MTGTTLLWYTVAMLFVGVAGGIVIGVMIDRDKIYNTIIKKIRYKKGTGDVVIDVDQEIESDKREKKGLFQRIRERKENRTNP